MITPHLLSQKFTQTYPAVTIYYHTCKFTRRLFCTPFRRCTYSPAGLALKIEQQHQLKLATLQVCRVYFYQCPITKTWFSTRKAGSRYSAESKVISRQAWLDYCRQYRQGDEVRQKEIERRKSRKEYYRLYQRRRRVAARLDSL